MVYTTKECDFRNFVTSIVKTLQNSNRKFRDEEIKKKKLAYTIHRRSIILKETYIKIVITKILNDPKTTIEIGPLSEDNKDEIMGLIDDIDNIDHKP